MIDFELPSISLPSLPSIPVPEWLQNITLPSVQLPEWVPTLEIPDWMKNITKPSWLPDLNWPSWLGKRDLQNQLGFSEEAQLRFDAAQLIACSHFRGVFFFAESIISPCKFKSVPCDKYGITIKNK